MKGMKYGYARVSTDDQDPAVQEQQLRELIAQRGWTLQRTYSDRSSGAKERRPGLDTLTRPRWGLPSGPRMAKKCGAIIRSSSSPEINFQERM